MINIEKVWWTSDLGVSRIFIGVAATVAEDEELGPLYAVAVWRRR